MFWRLFPLLISLFITACQQAELITPASLQHHHWQLVRIDQVAVSQAPPVIMDLEIGEKMTVSGHTGCNQFFGQGNLQGAQLQVRGLAVTTQGCSKPQEWIEKAILLTLREGAMLSMSGDALWLKGEQHNLEYHLADWVH